MTRFAKAFVKYPFAPSIDRINCGFGYRRGNVRLVSTAVNFGLGQWGDEVFRTIAEATVQHQNRLIANQPASALDERINAAVAVLPLLSKAERQLQARRIAGLKRALTLGPEGLRKAVARAPHKDLALISGQVGWNGRSS